MKKPIRILLITTIVSAVTYFVGVPLVTEWFMSVPETAFDDTPLPDAPDYSNEDHWAALPWREDSADWLPAGSGYEDKQARAKVDVFFVHPTAAFYGDYWVAGMDNLLHVAAVDYGIQPQHITAFNGVGKIYAPRYRSVRMPLNWSDDKESVKKAIDLSYSDVVRAFDHYMKHWNKGRPIIIVSHSQGTTHTFRLLRDKFDGKPISKQLVAGYLVGMPVSDSGLQTIPLCESGEKTGCFVTWNTYIEGGDPSVWMGKKLKKLHCVNPLSWKADQVAVDKSENHGSIPMTSYRMLFDDTGPLHQGVVGARCGAEGILWFKGKPEPKGFSAALLGGGWYHAYDINFYFDSIRKNAAMRVSSFLENGG